MRSFRPILALFALLAAAHPAPAASSFAQTDHLSVQLVVPEDQLYPHGNNLVGLDFKLQPGWHVYWQNAGDSGEPPHIQWTLPPGVTVGPMQFPAPARLPLGPLMDFGYENEVLFPIPFRVADTVKSGPAIVHAQVDWLVCREVCIPGKAELQVTLHLFAQKPPTVSGSMVDAELMRRFLAQLPQPLPPADKAEFQPTTTGFRLGVQTGQRETQAEFFPSDQTIVDNPAPQKLTPTPTGLVLDLKKDPNIAANPAHLNGVLELSGGRNYQIAATPGSVAVPAAPTVSLLQVARIAALAFLGGLLLNLMPCVFPVLFLKGLALVQSGADERRKLRAHGFVYAAGIVASFWVLVAVLLGLRAAGAKLGWGFQFQSPIFLALMAALLFFLGLWLAGQFELGLTLTSAGGALVTKNGAAKQGYTGSFFTGVLAVVVATPCAAPFMGAAVGYALAAPAAVTFAIFTALALGLAAPYVALTLQPAWTRLLPRPGAWMEILKQAVSIPIFVTVIWLAWVLAQAYGANVLGALLLGLLLLAIAGWFLGRWPLKRWATVTAAILVLGAAALCVLAPGKLGTAKSSATAGEEHWQPWSPAAISRDQAEGRPVFVDFTASWCLSCQVNERVALDRPEVQQAFQNANVALLRADWTRHDEAITEALIALGRSGVPAYVLYAPGQTTPQLLPEVLTPGIVVDAIDKLPHTATQARAATSNAP